MRYFLGEFDASGNWSDGIFMHRLRNLCQMSRFDRPENEDAASIPAGSHNSVRRKVLHVLVLNGPLNHTVESLLASSAALSQRAGHCPLSASEVCRRSIVSAPTGELLRLGADVRIVLETVEMAHLSPTVLTALPVLSVTFSKYMQGSEQSARAAGKLSVKRIVTAWIRTLYNWLGDFTPWLATMDELQKVVCSNDVYCSVCAKTLSACLCTAADTSGDAIHRGVDLRRLRLLRPACHGHRMQVVGLLAIPGA